MKIEIAIYLLLAMTLFVYRTILSGRKNGCFYHKNDKPLPPMLKREIENLHFIETSAWYAQTCGLFLLLLALIRTIDHSLDLLTIFKQLITITLITVGSIQAASYHYQRGVTAGLRDDNNLDAITKSEVAINIGKLHIQFWKPRLFSNKGRILAQWLGIIEIFIGIILLISKIK